MNGPEFYKVLTVAFFIGLGSMCVIACLFAAARYAWLGFRFARTAGGIAKGNGVLRATRNRNDDRTNNEMRRAFKNGSALRIVK